MHYFGDYLGIRIIPNFEKEERPTLLEKSELVVIGRGTLDDIDNLLEEIAKK